MLRRSEPVVAAVVLRRAALAAVTAIVDLPLVHAGLREDVAGVRIADQICGIRAGIDLVDNVIRGAEQSGIAVAVIQTLPQVRVLTHQSLGLDPLEAGVDLVRNIPEALLVAPHEILADLVDGVVGSAGILIHLVDDVHLTDAVLAATLGCLLLSCPSLLHGGDGVLVHRLLEIPAGLLNGVVDGIHLGKLVVAEVAEAILQPIQLVDDRLVVETALDGRLNSVSTIAAESKAVVAPAEDRKQQNPGPPATAVAPHTVAIAVHVHDRNDSSTTVVKHEIILL